jgi:hypothetical protein
MGAFDMKILIDEEVVKQALDALGNCESMLPDYHQWLSDAQYELRTALQADTKVEPVAWMQVEDGVTRLTTTKGGNAGVWQPLYLHAND